MMLDFHFELYQIATVSSWLNFHPEDGVHNLQIGKNCSIAENVSFLIDVNHDYRSVFQGEVQEFTGLGARTSKIRRKGQILIMNDCWIGRGVPL